jgi:hypothetical protein
MALFRRKGSGGSPTGMPALADELGLSYADEVDDGYLETMGPLPDLPLLREGNDDSLSRIVYGTIDDVGIRAFDFESASHADDRGLMRTCALVTVDGSLLPEVFIAPKERLPRLGEKLRESGVAIGSPEFMQKFSVQAHGREHAVNLIGPDVEQWLLTHPIDHLRVEIRGGAILGHVPRVEAVDDVRKLVILVRGFHARIPELVWHSYRMLN